MAKTQPKVQQPARKGRASGQMTLWLSVGFVILIIVSLPTVMVIFFGLLPTIVAAIVDRSPQRNATFCVGGINFCGVFPYMMQLWAGNNSMDDAMTILTDVFSLVVMYGAASFGWMIFLTLPPVVAAFVSVIHQHKVATLRTTQRRLIEEWGEDVATPQEVLDMRAEIETDTETAIQEAGGDTTGTVPSGSSSKEVDVDDFLAGIDSILAESANAQPLAANGAGGSKKAANG